MKPKKQRSTRKPAARPRRGKGARFTGGLDDVRRQVDDLARLLDTGEETSEVLLPLALEHLRTTLEELSVADEELRQQNEELAATRLTVEAERHRYHDFFAAAPDGYVVTDPSGIIREVNRAAARFLGMAAARLTGKPLALYVADGERRAFRLRVSALAKQGVSDFFETHLQPWRGEPMPVAISVSPLLTAAGKADGLRWIVHDLSDREEEHRLLNVSEQGYQQVMNLLSEAVLVHQAGKYVLANEAALALFGAKEPEDLVGRKVLAFVAPESRPIVRERMRRALAGEPAPRREVRLLRLDGRAVDVEAESAPVVYLGRAAVQVIIRDITRRKEAESARDVLQQANVQLTTGAERHAAEVAAVFAAMTDAVVVYDAAGKVIEANAACRTLYGLDPAAEGREGFIGKLAIRSSDGRTIAVKDLPCSRALVGETVIGQPLLITTVDGREITLLGSAAPLRVGGKVVGAVAVDHDITHMARAEEELRKSHEELEARVQQRTRDLAQANRRLRTEIAERQAAEQVTQTINVLLDLFAKKATRKEYLDSVVQVLRHWSGCRCVGIRVVNERGEIPYASLVGFSREFWEHENRLSLRNDTCACIRVIGEVAESQDQPYRTPCGSFRTDDSAQMLKALTPQEQVRFRGHCIQTGFKSLAIVPIRCRDQTIGAVHLADERAGMVPPRVVEFIETMTPLIGEAINRFNVEEALRESEQRYRTLVHVSPEAVGVVADGRFALVNAAGVKVAGVAGPEDMLGREVLSFVHPDDRPLVAARMQQVMAEGDAPVTECRVVRPSGEIVDIEIRATRIAYEGGVAVLALVTDATARKASERQIRLTNELLERMFSSIHVLVAYMDRDFNFIRVNRAYADADGRDTEFFRGKNHFALYPNDENEVIFRRTVETGEPYLVSDKAFVYADHPERGATYWDWSLLPVRDEAGRVTGLILSLLDVTDRKLAQQRVEIERQRLFTVLNMLPGFVLLHDADHRVCFANQRFIELFGDPAGRPCFTVMRKREAVCEACPAEDVLRSGSHREWEWTSPAGRDYHIWGYPFWDTGGTRCVLQLGIDITERNELEREILEISGEEQRRIGRDLHDVLGQNLTGIAFLSKVLAQRLATEGAAAAEQAGEISGLANQAVAQARAISRNLCPVDLAETGLMRALEELTGGVEKLFGIRCTLECPELITLDDIAVATHLYHIAQEAVNNATKHARCRSIRVTFERSDAGLLLAVRDDGIGLPDGAAAGEGMGLRIMRHRANMIGAHLEVRPVPEGGTRVLCRVPKG